ncbi:hypothetical protein [Natrinema thermotolerans]
MNAQRSLVRRFVDTVLVGNRWRTFCGCSQATLLEGLTEALEDHGLPFEIDERSPSDTDRFLYGSDADGVRVTITEPSETELTVVPVTADPVSRTVLSMAVREDVRERTTAGVCLVDVSPLPDDEGELAALMRTVMDRLECDPWDLADHPRFRLAVVQRYKIRAKWRYWSRLDAAGGSVSTSY